MTTNNFNKIARTKLNLSSQILSKNTNEIVNTCIEKLYKLCPTRFQTNLKQVKNQARPRTENCAPLTNVYKAQEQIRRQKLNEVIRKPPKFATGISTDQNLLLMSVMRSCKNKRCNRYALNNKENKFLKSRHNFNIYSTSRNFGSSGSTSSSASLLLCGKSPAVVDRRSMRLKYPQPIIKSGAKAMRPVCSLNTNASSCILPARNQSIASNLDSVPMALQVSTQIQRDLMTVDNRTKQRLCSNHQPNKSTYKMKTFSYPQKAQNQISNYSDYFKSEFAQNQYSPRNLNNCFPKNINFALKRTNFRNKLRTPPILSPSPSKVHNVEKYLNRRISRTSTSLVANTSIYFKQQTRLTHANYITYSKLL